MNNNMMQIQREAKYKSARTSLIIILVASVINIFSIAFADSYFLFSSYFTTLLAALGATLYVEAGSMALFVVFALLALVSLVPYLLCFIFSKKHPGWMIAALVLFSLDTLLLLLDFAAALLIGDFGMIIDMLFHVYALVCLAIAVKHGMAARKTPQPENVPAAPLVATEGEAPAEGVGEEIPVSTRSIYLHRKNALTGFALQYNCYIDGAQIDVLKNGNTVGITTSSAAHEVGIMAPGGEVAVSIAIPADEADHHYSVRLKSGAFRPKLIVEEIPDPNAQ